MLRITELRACVSLFLDLQYDGNRRRPHGARSFAEGKFQSLIFWNKTGRIRQCNSRFSTAVFVSIQQNPRVKTSKFVSFGPFYTTTCLAKNLKQVLIF